MKGTREVRLTSLEGLCETFAWWAACRLRTLAEVDRPV